MLPTVVDENGQQLDRSDVVSIATQLAQVAQLAKIRKSLARQEFRGVEDPRILNATDQMQVINLINNWPYTLWISAYFVNDGPDTVKLSLNQPFAPFMLRRNGTITIDRAHADERINSIYYVCAPGETGAVEVVGQY